MFTFARPAAERAAALRPQVGTSTSFRHTPTTGSFAHPKIPRKLSRAARMPEVQLPKLHALREEAVGARRAFLTALIFRVRMLSVYLRVTDEKARSRAQGHWAKARARVARLLAARRRWRIARNYVALRVWVRRWQGERAGRGWRERKATTYREARRYEKGKRETSGRTVQRRANGADVGIVMLWRLEGRTPMTEMRPRRRRTEGDG